MKTSEQIICKYLTLDDIGEYGAMIYQHHCHYPSRLINGCFPCFCNCGDVTSQARCPDFIPIPGCQAILNRHHRREKLIKEFYAGLEARLDEKEE